ncbi:MAG: potassium channel family protein [Planctomycetota bacterium]
MIRQDAKTAAIVAPERALMDRPLLTDTYHHLVSMSWPRYLLLLVVVYSFLVVIFAAAYEATGTLVHAYRDATSHDFGDSLHFSYVTMTTVGYGDIRPVGVGRVISAVQALVGVILIGIFSAMAFVRLSRATARVAFSQHMVLGSHVGKPALMFRLTNLRLNKLLEVKVTLYFMWVVQAADSSFQRRWQQLRLLPDTHPVLQFTWMVVAPLDDPDSPLFDKNVTELQALDGLFIAVLSGYDETLSHSSLAHHVWLTSQVVSGQFTNVLRPDKDGRPMPVSLDMLDQIEPHPRVRNYEATTE